MYRKEKEIQNFYRSDDSTNNQLNLLHSLKSALLSTTSLNTQKQINYDIEKIYSICLLSLVLIILFILCACLIYFKEKIKVYFKNSIIYLFNNFKYESDQDRTASMSSIHSSKSTNKINLKQNTNSNNNFSNFES